MKTFWFAASLLLVSQTAISADVIKAEQLLNAGQVEAALTEVEAVLAEDPTNPDGRFLQGIALAQLGRNADAIAVFKDLTNDYREIPEPYNNLAVMLAQSGDYTGARNALEEAVKYHPSYTVAWENLADIYSVMATEAYEKVLEQEPTNLAAKQRLALMSGTTEPAALPNKPVAKKPKPSQVTANNAPTITAPPGSKPATTTTNAAPASVVENSAEMSPQQYAVMKDVTRWAQRWSARDIEGYLSAYGDDYQPQDNQTRRDWEKARRARLAKPATISLNISQPSVTFLDSDLAMVKFVQDYQSESYSDNVRKTLLMENNNGTWLIVREQSIR